VDGPRERAAFRPVRSEPNSLRVTLFAQPLAADEALVASVQFNACVVRLPGGVLASATVRGVVRGRDKALGNAVVVGDRVRIERDASGDAERVVIADVATRANAFSRRAPGREPAEQVVAANLDQVAIVASLADPEFRPGFVDRVLAQCAHAGIPTRLVLNKTDLDATGSARAVLADYAVAGVPGHALSAKQGEGVAALHAVLHGRRSLFVGHSGVGKSSLLNALEPGFDLLVGEVNAKTGKGRHTTTHAVLLRPERDVELIDTPGMRAFGLWGIDPMHLENAYPEFAPHLGRCRFGDCSHAAEPGCAVRAAVESGAIARRRYESFLKLREELAAES
jgi:ribosome biogenesis GTPase